MSHSRKHVLKGIGASLALPMMETYLNKAEAASKTGSPKRFFAMTQDLGCIHDTWFPTEVGSNYKMPRVMSVLKEHKKECTVFSNIDHNLKGGHHAASGVLNGVKNTDAIRSPFGAESIDQTIAKKIGHETRFESLQFWGGGQKLSSSCSRSGSHLPSSGFVPSEMFHKLFITGTKAEIEVTKNNLSNGKSILDIIEDEAKSFEKGLSHRDKDKLDQYYSAIRSSEKSLQNQMYWVEKDKPKLDLKPYKKVMDGTMDKATIDDQLKIWIDLIHLALTTDSTRSITLTIPTNLSIWNQPHVEKDAHYYSHHGKEEDKKEAFRSIEKYIVTQYSRLLKKLKEDTQLDGSSLLDSTIAVYASGLSNGSTHSNSNLPLVVAGGNFQHGRHIDNGFKESLNSLYYSFNKYFDPSASSFNGATKEHSWQEVS